VESDIRDGFGVFFSTADQLAHNTTPEAVFCNLAALLFSDPRGFFLFRLVEAVSR